MGHGMGHTMGMGEETIPKYNHLLQHHEIPRYLLRLHGSSSEHYYLHRGRHAFRSGGDTRRA